MTKNPLLILFVPLALACNLGHKTIKEEKLVGGETFDQLAMKIRTGEGVVAFPTGDRIYLFNTRDLRIPSDSLMVPNTYWDKYLPYINDSNRLNVIRPENHSADFVNRMPASNISACALIGDSLLFYSLTLNYAMINSQGTHLSSYKILLGWNIKKKSQQYEYAGEFLGEIGYILNPYEIPVLWQKTGSFPILCQTIHDYDSINNVITPTSRFRLTNLQQPGQFTFIDDSSDTAELKGVHGDIINVFRPDRIVQYSVNGENIKAINTSGNRIVDYLEHNERTYFYELVYNDEGIMITVYNELGKTPIFEKQVDDCSRRFQLWNGDLVLFYDKNNESYVVRF